MKIEQLSLDRHLDLDPGKTHTIISRSDGHSYFFEKVTDCYITQIKHDEKIMLIAIPYNLGGMDLLKRDTVKLIEGSY